MTESGIAAWYHGLVSEAARRAKHCVSTPHYLRTLRD